MEASDRSRLFDELTAAAVAMREFLEAQGGTARLTAREMHALERLAERYDRAHDALSQEIERVIRRSTGRPRR